MLKVNDDILKKLGIEYCFLSGDGNSFVHPVELEKEGWLCNVDNKDAVTGSMYMLNIYTGTETVRIPVSAEHKEKSAFFLRLPDNTDNQPFIVLRNRIFGLEKKIAEWSRRSEERFDVGLRNSSDFGLVEKQQKLLDSEGKELPFAVSDVSFHGLKIVTTDSDTLEKNKEVCLMLKFRTQLVVVKARVMNKKTEESVTGSGLVLAKLNLKIDENNIPYQELVEKYAAKKD